MSRSKLGRALAAALATLSVALLAGCSIGPLELPDIDLSGIVEALTPTSVAEAREARKAEVTQDVSDSSLVTAGTLTVGILTSETAPLAGTSDDGTAMGIDYDVAYALADELGLLSVEFVSVTSVDAGLATCDVVLGATSDSTSATVYGNYAQDAIGVFTTASVDSVPVSLESLSGATVGVQSGSVSEETLNELAVSVTPSTYSNLNEAFEALAAGEVDYVVCDVYAGSYLAASYDGVSYAGLLTSPTSVGVAVSSDATELGTAVQSAMDSLDSNGVADLIRSRWLSFSDVVTSDDLLTGIASE